MALHLERALTPQGTRPVLNPAGLKVDDVAYTRQQAEAEGWTAVF